MIDKSAFRDVWAVLEERFGKEHSGPTRAMYYQSLSEKLSTEEFKVAARRLFDSAEFFPKPDDFVEEVRGDTETRALKSWETVDQVVRGFASRDELTDEAERTVKLMGGMRQLRMTRDENWPHRRREFLKLYGDAERIEAQESKEELPPGDTSAEDLLEEATGAVSLPGDST